MKIGELAALSGVAASAIRFYEQSGLLPGTERGNNGYRAYGDDAVERLSLIRMAQSLGFSLDALRAIFTGSEGFSKDELLRSVDARIGEIDQLMATLRAQRRDLADVRQTMLQSWDAGQCVDAATLQKGMTTQPARRSKAGTASAAQAPRRQGPARG